MISQVTIIGLGLIGGSIALALRERGGVKVAAVDDAAVISDPRAVAMTDERVAAQDRVAFSGLLSRTELAVLAVPVGDIARLLPEVLQSAQVATDCGSTKEHIARVGGGHERGRFFVPGHPMAGRPVGGLANASATLFVGARWLLCPQASDPGAVQVVESLVAALGGLAVHVEPEHHDRGVALTSHVPQLFASALAVLATRQQAWEVSGPGFASATRVAGGAESMWRDILATNAGHVAGALRALMRELEVVASDLEGSPTEVASALRLLAEARQAREDAAPMSRPEGVPGDQSGPTSLLGRFP